MQETKWNILLVDLFLNLQSLSLASAATEAVSLLFMKADGEWNMNFEYNENILLVLIKACEMLCEMFHTNQKQQKKSKDGRM